jgi:5-methylcytosine-specific restriction protein A
LIKPLKICSTCRKPKKPDCEQCKPKAFSGINKDNYSFYNSTQWRKVSKGYRKRHPLCKHCEEIGRVTPSAVVDHIKPIDKGGDKWNSSNLQALCHKCHNKKSAKSK